MLMADLGADVIRVDRPAVNEAQRGAARADTVNRGKRSVAVDLKDPAGNAFVRRLVATADILVEGFRPGVVERLGLGPEELTAENPGLVYTRMTGWGQDGPLAQAAGHDINYIALTGALWASGRADELPSAPLNILGDYAGGSMFLVMGALSALVERAKSGQGQVIDVAMTEGTSVLTTMFTALTEMGMWNPSRRGVNLTDSGAPWYDVYECKDGKYISVGALEPQFYALLVQLSEFRMGDGDSRFIQPGPDQWAPLKAEWAEHWCSRTQQEWIDLLGETDACVQPVLDWAERTQHPQMRHRGVFDRIDGVTQPAPAPRLSRTPGAVVGSPPVPGEDSRAIAIELGLSDAEIEELVLAGAVAEAAEIHP